MQPRPGGKGSCGGQGRARRHCGANPPQAGVPDLPAVEPAATRPKAWAGDGCQGPWTRDDERAFETPLNPPEGCPANVGVVIMESPKV